MALVTVGLLAFLAWAYRASFGPLFRSDAQPFTTLPVDLEQR